MIFSKSNRREQYTQWFSSESSDESMEFRLSYRRGEVQGNGDPAHKHAIRRAFHGQSALIGVTTKYAAVIFANLGLWSTSWLIVP